MKKLTKLLALLVAAMMIVSALAACGNSTTQPTTPDPTPSTQKSLYPIVFDNVTISDYTENVSEYVVSNGTNY